MMDIFEAEKIPEFDPMRRLEEHPDNPGYIPGEFPIPKGQLLKVTDFLLK